ncbi:hypothetical protein [Aminivibrio sp.]|uniref:hypothetical protein n=1 Tax=Aminivibrio sp. TaxID=1872489 RepID=UPI001A503FB3|nr:hypothetical protein [Aminivibrio sp.]MBL3539924.1 hypothetical protein [Aminivibrio sp.]
MTTNEETVRLAHRVNGLVKAYMAVQDDLFRPSLRKILRIPGIYKPVDYEKNGEILQGLLDELVGVKSAIRHDVPDSSPEEIRFLGALRGYVSLMTSAVEKLRLICDRLGERSRGAAYGKEDYRSDMTELRVIQKKHLEAGLKLNGMIQDLAAGRKKEEGED